MENFPENNCCSSWTREKSFQELVFKAVKNRRKRSSYVDRKQVRSIDRNLFFFQTEATHFETMMNTVNEVNSDIANASDEFIVF